MDRDKLIFNITEAMVEGCGVGDIEYAIEIADRLLFKESTKKQVNEVLSNLSMGFGVQNTFILIESF